MLRSGSANDEGVEVSPSTSRPRSGIRVRVRRVDCDHCDYLDVCKHCDSSMKNGILPKFCEFWREGKYVDVTFKFDDGQQFSCHRNILASSSSYFDNLFSDNWKEAKKDVIHLKEDSSQVFGSAMEIIYAGTCTFDLDDFFDLLLLAEKYDIKVLQDSFLRHRWVIKKSGEERD